MAKKTFGEIQPWDGTSGTGAEAREVVKDNFDLVNEAIDDLILPAGEIDQKINARIVHVEGDSITLVLSQDAITKLLFTKINKDAVKQVSGTSTTDLMSQNAITLLIASLNEALSTLDEDVSTALSSLLLNKISTSAIKQVVGSSEEDLMSQRAISDLIAAINQGKVEITSIKQVAGTSESDLMSQKAITAMNGMCNLTTEFPLGSGNYNLTTAIAAVPVVRRKPGLLIKFFSGTAWLTYQFNGTQLSEWSAEELWASLNVKNETGASLSDWMSQNAVSYYLGLKFDKSSLESARSQSTTKAPTSKLLDDELTSQKLYAKLLEKQRQLPYVSDASDANCLFLTGNSWVGVPSFNSGTSIIAGVLTFPSVNSNKGWYLAGVLTNGAVNVIRIRAKGSVNGCKLFIGSSFSSAVTASNVQITLTTEYAYYDVTITAGSADLYITLIAANQPSLPVTIEVAEVYPKIYKEFAVQNDIDLLNQENSLDKTSVDNSKYPVFGNNATMTGDGSWVAGVGAPTFDINSTVAGKMFIDFTSGQNQQIKIASSLIVGRTYKFKVKARLISGASMPIRLGMFASSGGAYSDITPTSTEREYTGSFVCANVDMSICALSATNTGANFEIDDFYVWSASTIDEEQNARIATLEFADDTYDVSKSYINGNDSDMSGANNWVNALGTFTFDVNTTVAGKMYIAFTAAANNAVKLSNLLTLGQTYFVKIKVRLVSGTSMPIRIGRFASSGGGYFDITPDSTEKEYTGSFVATGDFNFYIGALAATNAGSVYAIDYVILYQPSRIDAEQDDRLAAIESREINIDKLQSFYTESFLQSLSRYDKPLTKLGIVGDSLMANAIGGNIPAEFDEGVTKRPIRLVTNQIARRIYDLISWNKATHRRLDDADWTKSGTWTTITTGLFEGAQDTYHKTIESGAYVEITVPTGKENFAFICRRDAGLGVLNVTLNGGNIAAYGASSVDLDRAKANANDLGNAFHTVLYTGLPAGDNVIRIAKETNTEEVQIFGGFYWTGNTLVIHNVAHGGHNLSDLLTQHLQAEVIENDFDAILFEIPLMNEAGHGTGISAAQTNLQTILNTVVNGKDVAFMSCQPFGTDPTDGTPNYYELYSNPTMEAYNKSLRSTLFSNNMPFVDVFSFFKKKIENRGGTLETGEGGLWYTHDGQHQSEAGMREYWNMIKYVFENKPIRYS